MKYTMLYIKISVKKEIEMTVRIKRSDERNLSCHGGLDTIEAIVS